MQAATRTMYVYIHLLKCAAQELTLGHYNTCRLTYIHDRYVVSIVDHEHRSRNHIQVSTDKGELYASTSVCVWLCVSVCVCV